MSHTAFCTAKTVAQANTIVERLKTSGITNEHISVVMADNAKTRQFAVENNTKAPEAAVTGGTTGMAIGGALGWLTGIGALAIPGLGPLIAAGPIMAALSGAAVGGLAGGVTGALVGMGIPEYEAKEYEERLHRGESIITVTTFSHEDNARVERIFHEAGAEHIHANHGVEV
jgi:uncharacterized membrane protein